VMRIIICYNPVQYMDLFKPIYDALSSPVWASISVISTIILAIITGIQLRLKEKKGVSYSIITDTPVIRVKEDVEKDIKISFKDKPVKNVRLVELKIWNSGNVPVKKEDYEEPLSFLPAAIELGRKLLYVAVIDKSPKDLPVKPIIYHDKEVIGLPKVLLNKGDSVKIKILLADYDEKIIVEGRILDVSRIEEVKNNMPSLLLRVKIISVGAGLFTSLIFYYAFSLLQKFNIVLLVFSLLVTTIILLLIAPQIVSMMPKKISQQNLRSTREDTY
jgi:hypothetical protein